MSTCLGYVNLESFFPLDFWPISSCRKIVFLIFYSIDRSIDDWKTLQKPWKYFFYPEFYFILLFQRQHFRRPMAERQETRARRGIPRSVVVQGRVDTRIQRSVRRQTVGHHQRKVRRDLGERTTRRLRVRNICWRWYVKFCFLHLYFYHRIFIYINR